MHSSTMSVRHIDSQVTSASLLVASLTIQTECGVLNGDNSTCADECGVPNGDNSTCFTTCGDLRLPREL